MNKLIKQKDIQRMIYYLTEVSSVVDIEMFIMQTAGA